MFKKSILFLSIISFSFACGDDDESPSYTKADLLGTWEMTATTDPDPEACEEEILTFTNDELQITTICDGSEITISTEYEVSGQTVTAAGGSAKILELSSSTMKVEYDGDDGKYTTTYAKQ
ncbi:MAG TPA: hypothetical protein VD927_02100 [Chryseosolibacter sp.]|nr:hypothetical protein [Chryseosolibacter sp.]